MSFEVDIDIETNGLTPDTIWMVGQNRGDTYTEHFNTFTFNDEDT